MPVPSVYRLLSDCLLLTMANEELIYRITRAVYGRLGAAADASLVEQLVMDIYRAIEPLTQANGAGGAGSDGAATAAKSASENAADRIVVSVFGVDHPGIVAAVTQVLAEADCSIIDINQTVVQGKFAMVIIANAARARESVAALKERCRREGERLGVRIYVQREDLFNAMHRI